MSFTRDTPYEATKQDRFMGAVLLLTIVIVLYLGLQGGGLIDRLTDKRLRFSADMSQTYGIAVGSVVSMSGVSIGRVIGVELTPQARVKIHLELDNEFRSFLRQGSRLSINRSLGLDTVISGTGLVFVPGTTADELANGSILPVEEPRSMDDIIDIEGLAAQAKDIINDLRVITSTLSQNQGAMFDTINNSSKITAALIPAVESIPPMLSEVQLLMSDLRAQLSKADGSVEQLTTRVDDVLASTEAALDGMAVVLQKSEPALEGVPGVLASTTATLDQTEQLLQKLNRHWLFGQTTDVVDKSKQMPIVYDDGLYKTSEKITDETRD